MAKSKVDYWLTDEGLTLLKGWARDGLTEEDIANNCGVVRSTLSSWKNKYEDISNAIKKNKEIADYVIENALYKRAKGFEYTYDKQKVTKDGDIVNYEETVYFPPDPTAIIYWLKNRKSKVWRDKQDKDNKDALDKLDQLLEEQKNA